MFWIHWQSFLLGAGTILIGSVLLVAGAVWVFETAQLRARGIRHWRLAHRWREHFGSVRRRTHGAAAGQRPHLARSEFAALDPRRN